MEGPQTRALADHLNDQLTGKPVERIVVPENRWQANMMLLNCVGQVIQRVRSHGKWLFFDFSHGVTWMCQLITRAQWRVVPANSAAALAGERGGRGGERGGGRRRDREPLIVLYLRNGAAQGAGAAVAAVLSGRPIFYIVPSDTVRSHPEIRNLGPDPLATATFYDDFPYRLRQTPGRTVAAALLDQEVIAGVGNMLKCEVLFAMRFAPSLRVGALFASQVDQLAKGIVGLAAMATTAATQGRGGSKGGGAGGAGEAFPHRVYDRSGLPCTVCQAEIVADRSGQDAHLTWYCPECQRLGHEETLFSGPAGGAE